MSSKQNKKAFLEPQESADAALDPQRVREVLDAGIIDDTHLAVLRWLVWLPLLSREELARVVLIEGETRSEQTLWSYLHVLVLNGLVEAVVAREPGSSPRQQRYYVTDLGLAVVAARSPHPISTARLAMSYPVTDRDLLDRLARPRVTFALTNLLTRLFAECPVGSRVISFQQPYRERFRTIRGKGQTVQFDAALLIESPDGSSHAFYVRVDQAEHMLAQREIKAFVKKLLTLRQWTHLQRDVMPHFLLLSSRERFFLWAEQVNRVTLASGNALLDVDKPEPAREHMDLSCLVADLTDLDQGAYAPIWTPFHALIQQQGTVHQEAQKSLHAFLERKASPHRIAAFSRQGALRTLLAPPTPRASGRRAASASVQKLPRYVTLSLQQVATPLIVRAAPGEEPYTGDDGYDTADLVAEIEAALRGTEEERVCMSALLTLALTEQQKNILAHLAHHPHLARADLMTLLRQTDDRLLTRLLTPLIALHLVQLEDPEKWRTETGWRERERYALCESALRYLAVRHGLTPAFYLERVDNKKHKKQKNETQPPGVSTDAARTGERQVRRNESGEKEVWVQRGAAGLGGYYLEHTSGVYFCVRSILQASYRTHAYTILYWKSAFEAVRWYSDLLDRERIEFVRPDGELLYTTPDAPEGRSLLLEYDRNTAFSKLLYKFCCYTEYQSETRSTLPTTLVIAQDETAMARIARAIDQAKAFDVSLLVLPKYHIVRYGLTKVLPLLQ